MVIRIDAYRGLASRLGNHFEFALSGRFVEICMVETLSGAIRTKEKAKEKLTDLFFDHLSVLYSAGC